MVRRMENTLLHVASEADVARARETGRYRADSLEAEGFLHCCDEDQLAGVLARYFRTAEGRNVDGVVVLRVDASRLDAPVVRENTVGGDEPFPHVYGEVPLAAIVAVEPLPEPGGPRGPGGPGNASVRGGPVA